MTDDSNQIAPSGGPTDQGRFSRNTEDVSPGQPSDASAEPAKEKGEAAERSSGSAAEKVSADPVHRVAAEFTHQAPRVLGNTHRTARPALRGGNAGLIASAQNFARRQPVAFFAVAALTAFVLLRLVTSSRGRSAGDR